ncbi:hypothetical protein [Streptomyces lavendulae]|uniref:hypothetical protein n=1 Tax=Streptomyces lavendulae TaxID=1914 RepID=UPI0024A4EF48|nr:hypothetical protein [Streptomyces lavendulae]GLW00137.1 hypothetical protein Slala05_37680 [Streptomyces lavendulae subsp. lavendulae]
MRKSATVLAALAIALAGASPANAAVDSQCGRYICVMTAHHNRFVQDITVQTRDGNPGVLRAYWGSSVRGGSPPPPTAGTSATNRPEPSSSAAAWSATAAPSRTASASPSEFLARAGPVRPVRLVGRVGRVGWCGG